VALVFTEGEGPALMQLIIPAYNEEARLPGTLRDLQSYVSSRSRVPQPIEVIVVDNNSTDATAAVAAAATSPALPVRVISCLEPGKGAAVRAGIAATDADLVGFMDADGATALEAYDEAWRQLTLGADVAIASRAVAGSRCMVRHSRLRERGAAVYRNLAGHVVPGIYDTQCGFKLMRGDLARRVFAQVETTGFSFDIEFLARAQAMGAAIAEFPVTWVDVAGSTFHPVRHGFASFADVARIAWRTRDLRAARGRVVPAFAVAAPVVLEPAIEL